MDRIFDFIITKTFQLNSIKHFKYTAHKKQQHHARAVRYDDIYRMDEIKSLSFHIMFYRLFRGVAKYIVYGTFSSFGWLRSLHATTGREGETEAGGERPELNEGLHL